MLYITALHAHKELSAVLVYGIYYIYCVISAFIPAVSGCVPLEFIEDTELPHSFELELFLLLS